MENKQQIKRAIQICSKRGWALTTFIRKFIKQMDKTLDT